MKKYNNINSAGFALHFPMLLKYWADERDPNKIGRTSKKKIRFICENNREIFISPHYISKLKDIFLPFQKVKSENRIHILRPDIEKFYDKQKNTLPFNKITTGMNIDLHFKCEKGHYFSKKAKHLVGYSTLNCMICAGRDLSYDNRLDIYDPLLLKEWDFHKNKETPDMFPYNSNKKVWWKCENNHSWKAAISERTGTRYKNKPATKCPYCYTFSKSRLELIIFSELHQFFSHVTSGEKILDKEVDIFIKDLNLAIEYDGAYFHKNKYKKDKEKNNILEENGFSVLRIREKGLRRINPIDYIFNPENDIFEPIEYILKYILKHYNFNRKKEIEIRKYLNKKESTNLKFFNKILYRNKISKITCPVKISCYSDKNKLPIHYYGNGSGFKATWECPSCKHNWQSRISQSKIICPSCKCSLAEHC